MDPTAPLNRKQRVLVVAPQPFYEDRGTPIAVRQFIEALTHLDHDVDLVTYPIGETVALEGVRYVRAANPLRIRRVPIGFSARKLALDATLVVALRRQLRRQRYDFIHAVEEAAFPAVWLGRKLGIPVIYDMQSSLPEQMLSRRVFRPAPIQRALRSLERWALRHADLVISSAGLAERVRQSVPEARIREWKFASLSSGVPEDERAELRRSLDLDDSARVVLYSGTFASYQGLFELMRAIPRVRQQAPEAVFVLVGAEGEDGAIVRERAREIGLGRELRLLSRKPREEMPAYLALADVLVSPRRHGGNLPLKIFDYLAAGRPIVATDIPTHRSVLTPELAELVQPNEQAIADGIVRVLNDSARARALARGAAHYAYAQLGWLTFVDSVQELSRAVRQRD